jgi:hypothetical protein
MPKRGAQNDVCSSGKFMGMLGFNSTNSNTDNARFKVKSEPYRMTTNRLLPGSPTLGWYLGVVVLDVVRGERVFD